MRRARLLLLLSGGGPLFGQDVPSGPFARVRLEPGSVVTVGQPLAIVVEVLVPSYFTGAPSYPHLDVADAIVLFEDRGANFTERFGSTTFAGQSRRYRIYPQRAGTYEIAEIPVFVRYFAEGVGLRAEATVSPPEPVRFEAVLPEEARDLSYFIATTALTLEQTLEPDARRIRVGDALTRTVTTTVENALSMVIPPLEFPSIDGLRIYAEPPAVEDEGGERARRVVGRRVESVTYVAEQEGSYDLPGIEWSWWDVSSERLRRAVVPAVTVEVIPNPDAVAEIELPPEEDLDEEDVATSPRRISLVSLLRRFGLPLLLVGVVLLVVARFAPGWRTHWAESQRQRAESEAAYFERFRRAARSGDPAAAMRELMRWLDRRLERGKTAEVAARFETFVRAAGDPELEREAHIINSVLFSSHGNKVGSTRIRVGKS